MPLDENFPTYQYAIPDATNVPSITTIHFTISGSIPQHLYTLHRFPQPANTYSISLSDAPFPDITYGSLSLPLLPSTTNPNELQRPSSFTLQLYSPDSTVTITQKHTALTRNNFWEFSLPKSSFLPPTQSALDASYHPPVSEMLTFRWRKEGMGMLTRSQLKCSLVAGGDEPDTVLAMYSGIGDKSGKGELVVYESNFRRVEMQDLKGLEMVMLLSARVVADVWFSGSSAFFNTTQRIGTGVGGPAPPPPYEPPAASSSGTFAERFNSQIYPPDKPTKPVPAPAAPTTTTPTFTTARQPAPRQSFAPQQPHVPKPQAEEKIVDTFEELAARQRIADEQAEIRRMLAEEERVAARRQAKIDAETERLKRLYEQEALEETRKRQQQRAQRPHTQPLGQNQRGQPQPQRVDPRMQTQRLQNYGVSRPPVVGSSTGGWHSAPAQPMHINAGLAMEPGKRLDDKSRRKSFFGLNFGGGEREREREREKGKEKEKEKERAREREREKEIQKALEKENQKNKGKGKLSKKTSRMW